MPATTTRHGFSYPLGTDPVGIGGPHIKDLAERVDTELTVEARSAGGMKAGYNLAMYNEWSNNLPGYLVLDTNIPFNSHMCTITFTGWVYAPYQNIIDMTVSFYAYFDSQSIINSEVSNKGSFEFAEIVIMKHNVTGNVSIALKPQTSNNQWQYPKVAVDAIVGHTTLADANFKTGWSLRRAANLTGYTTKLTHSSYWQNVTSWGAGWTNLDTRICQYRKTAEGWVKFRGIAASSSGGGIIFTMPAGYLPEERTGNAHHIICNSSMSPCQIAINATNGQVIAGWNTNLNGWLDLSQFTYKTGPI